ncbi:MAG: glutamate racemase [Omnitrophica WOR_2 bacterium RIFOXYB2_FULL_38_16]|nr:MAG: glutamate racemase [Omnitrophica WOR_2 bacterium GWA2_37_7]OGX50693.1 MAG: glutamate racemase [Omnitrophica WOR_2 bacterium RIFOXYA2_FULL_38_17]OGX53232.1 MAG: glutamate racemase [Omnitrophica WOR_2 bacterium RIFOXYA12_FULL_38_10]OGX57403.1 MAG: glutamate racemase [Omnitrophica WOR_2 bacterium RIFOXYC2_FULL_38_12]OGX60325.1 MAG: glutamate racemase [Omnitrophica WOR_2 bacterium RIFOXYB2_FULL_38_16]HBG62361.1 glutamate racemase [Candidatus Omnitrophota bacterium]
MPVVSKKSKRIAPSNYAIGVFDSGLGGLTVVKEIIKLLPNEDIVYFGDTARVPYGTKSSESIVRFSIDNANVLMSKKVKMIVVACNSSSSYALEVLKKKFNVPILGVIEPGAQKAVKLTKNKKVGVIATSATVGSGKYLEALQNIDKSIKVISVACPLFVPLVEEGWANNQITADVAGLYLKNLKKENIDALILGCTHYPLLKTVISKVMGKKVALVDSAKEVAHQVEMMLDQRKNRRKTKQKARLRIFVSDKPQSFMRIAKSFLGCKIDEISCIKMM